MTQHQLDAMKIDLHPQATELIRKTVRQYSVSLLLASKLTAYRLRADLVLSNHVEQALQAISFQKEGSWYKQVGIIVGSALFGAFVQGFVNEVSSGNVLLIVTYTILGFIGMFLVFVGLRR
jgi:hypothetical protein